MFPRIATSRVAIIPHHLRQITVGLEARGAALHARPIIDLTFHFGEMIQDGFDHRLVAGRRVMDRGRVHVAEDREIRVRLVVV